MERNLKYFMHRSKVLQQYRMFQRVLSKLRRSPEVGLPHKEMAAQVRSEYQQHRDEADMQRAQFWYQEGERQLKTVLALVATTGPSGFDPFNMHQESRAAAYAQSDEPNTSRTAAASSGTHDDEGEVDTDSQGRLGVDWPWEGR